MPCEWLPQLTEKLPPLDMQWPDEIRAKWLDCWLKLVAMHIACRHKPRVRVRCVSFYSPSPERK